ncbi:hypothetical protein [Noviherbaspirillum sedimenti]|uniref:Uncharacterized protein n=1 Tax=Noviherbaspirillum sedimenti TaxID=2320865 RepID=A0A3A3FYM5_9BURK|nr:hypothetical protein [Noviherbaspirillum sedimenti]RJG01273.1 hypothetical protein D3878_06475 [Noviherbaspirillum sedimenti]
MDYPFQTIFSSNEGGGVIRLKVAAICAWLDYEDGGGHFNEEEIAPFFQTIEKTSPNGNKYEDQIDPHAFVFLEPTENLAASVEEMVNALIVSIDKGQLKPVFLKVGLDGVIDPVETWILTSDFYEWLEPRGFYPGDVCNDYDDGEGNIISHAYENACEMRKEFEAPYFNAEYRGLKKGLDSKEFLQQRYENLFLQNTLLKQGFSPEVVTEALTRQGRQEDLDNRPLRTRERNTLLSIIAVLCEEAKLNYTRHAKTAGLIRDMAERMGLNIGESTIENHLKKIPDALETRMK